MCFSKPSLLIERGFFMATKKFKVGCLKLNSPAANLKY